MINKLNAAILGFAVGDALGVPLEFNSRQSLKENPVIDMQEYGTYGQPKGTWSDDTSLTLCTMECLKEDINYTEIMNIFLKWLNEGYMTANGEIFDVGITTRRALNDFEQGIEPLNCGGKSEYDNGNGSLMRILPIAFYTINRSLEDRFKIVENISALTHAHKRSKIGCSIYVQFVLELLKGQIKEQALKQTIIEINNFYSDENELSYYSRILEDDIRNFDEEEIKSSGYVVDTLEAVIWTFLNTNSYSNCVLKAVNLGGDTDTIAAIGGGLAGIYYGIDSIPSTWIKSIAKLDEINELCIKTIDKLKNII